MCEAVEQGKVSRAEWRWAAGWALAVVALSCLPYLYAQFAAPPGLAFGGFIVNTRDGNSYLAKMREGYDGEWLFRLAFTPEEQRGLFVFTLYLALGHLSRLTGLPLVLVFHLARVAGGVFLLLSLYRLAAELTPVRAARRWAFAAAAFGSGLAVVSLLVNRNNAEAFTPLDLLVPEAVGFYSILSNPHFPLVFGLQIWAILWILHPPPLNRWIQIAAAAAVGLGIAPHAPYLAPVALVSAGAGMIAARPLRQDTIIRGAAMFGAMGLFLLYAVWAMRSDPAIAEWARQNVTPTPPPLDVVLGLGIWLPLAGVGAWRVQRERGWTPTLVSLLTWLILIAALIYFPYPLQRRFLGGVFAPLAALSGPGLVWLMSKLGRARIAAVAGVIVFGFTANVLVLMALFLAPNKADPAMYLTSDEAAALRWLESRAAPDDVVLADPRLGNFVPGWTGARVVYGHPMETIDAETKLAEVESFYEAGSDNGILDRYRVRYILGGVPPAGWQVVFESGAVKIYGR